MTLRFHMNENPREGRETPSKQTKRNPQWQMVFKQIWVNTNEFDGLVDWKVFYTVSAIFKRYNWIWVSGVMLSYFSVTR